VNASPETQLRLLDLQAADADLDRLAHRRRTVPEIADLERLSARLDDVGDDVVRAETEDSDLARDQKKIENEVDLVRTRADRDQQRLDSGAVSSARELEQLQSEIRSLARRQDDLEEQVLELMERREGVQARLAEFLAERERLVADRAAAEQRRDATFAEIDTAAGTRRGDRERIAAELPADLLGLYEKVRADKGGVGAAPLLRGRCEGCHLALPGSDLAALRAAPPDAVLRCEECRRILVRTPESGL
jgi:predicted  nucleic acid-binding Zn-ribbon protein